MHPSVSVVMPVRNGAGTLRSAIDDILGQTLRDLELIVVDDGSTDASRDVVLSVDDRRVRLVELPASGITVALNVGIEQARAELLARMDADDRTHCRRLEALRDLFAARPALGVAGTNALMIGPGATDKLEFRPPTRKGELQRGLLSMCWLIHGSTMFRRDVFEAVGGYRPGTEPAEDFDLWLRMAEVSEVGQIDEFLYTYVKHDQSQSSQRPQEQSVAAELALNNAVLRRGGRPDSFGRALNGSDALRRLGRSGVLRNHYWWARRLARQGKLSAAASVLLEGARYVAQPA